MNINSFFSICATLSTVLGGSVASCDPLPSNALTTLAQRDKALETSTTLWKNVSEDKVPGRTPDDVQRMQHAIRQQLPMQMRKRGVTDNKHIEDFVEHQVQEAPSMMKGYTVIYPSIWAFERRHNSLLVSGSERFGPHFIGKYQHYYNDNAGLIVNEGSRDSAGKIIHVVDPVVWGCPGNCSDYRTSSKSGLTLLPEEISLLTGSNPLNLYNAKWALQSTTAHLWILETEVTKGEDAPFSVQMGLDRDHGGIPAFISITGHRWSTNLRSSSFKQYRGYWITERLELKDQMPGFREGRQEWTLQSIKPSTISSVVVPPHRIIHDYRLLGQMLTDDDVLGAEEHRNRNIIYYRWSGSFPSIGQLKELRQKLYPGEAAPDLGQSGSTSLGALASASNVIGSALPFAGGVLCLVGGIWMFKQRKVN